MGQVIAVTGKGGVGKTTVAALIVRALVEAGQGPVLAVDADPNMCLGELLGVTVTASVGRVREEARQIAGAGMAAGISKQQMLELKIAESLVEADNFDLIAMGRCEGPGCYCYANNVLKQVIGQIARNYPYIVMDNEAGLENLSRRIVQAVDLMVVVADPSRRGLETARRLRELAAEMNIEFRRLALVVNRIRPASDRQNAADTAAAIGADDLVLLPEDDEVAAAAERGESIMTLSKDNPVLRQVDVLLAALNTANVLPAAAGTQE